MSYLPGSFVVTGTVAGGEVGDDVDDVLSVVMVVLVVLVVVVEFVVTTVVVDVVEVDVKVVDDVVASAACDVTWLTNAREKQGEKSFFSY